MSNNSVKTRQAWLIKPGKFELRETTISPGPEDILVKSQICGLCHWELNHWKGLLGPYPQTMGHEVGGTVVALGSDVPQDFVKTGQKVTGFVNMTGFADYALMNYKYAMRLTDGIALDETPAEPLMCVTTTVRGTAAELGDIGIVVGCGSMGLWAIQALPSQSMGALIAMDLDNDRLALAKKYGATHTINPKEVKDCAEVVKEISNGHMADFVIEGTGRPLVLDGCLDYLKVCRGRLIVMSSYEEVCTHFDWRKAQKGVEIKVTHPPYSLDPNDDVRRAELLVQNGTYNGKDIVTHRFDYEDLEKAFSTLEKMPSGYIKGIVVFPE